MNTLDAITNLMYQSSTLIGAVILVGALAYLGTNTISADHREIRRLVAYLSGTSLVLIGAFSAYFGASKLLTLLLAHIYLFDSFRIEWLGVGLLALVAGFLLLFQALRNM